MNRHRFKRFLVPVLAVLMLNACMLVEDFSAVWQKADADSCTSKIAEALYYTEFRRDPSGKDMATVARTITLGDKHFLMLKMDAADKGGRMYRFGVVNGIFQRYRLNPTMRKTFEAAYPKAPVSLKNDTVTFATLGEPVIKLITEISAKPEYWEIEDQTLYNVMRNPACKYEDRDLNALAEADKKKAKQ